MTRLQELGQEMADTINRLAQDDPAWGRFLTQMPAYRYFHSKGSKDRYFWTTQDVRHNGKLRFGSGVYKYIKTKKVLKLTQERYHARRKDAKARALHLYEQNKRKEVKRDGIRKRAEGG